MAKAKVVREIPLITSWSDAVDSVNYAKGTTVEVVKATKTVAPNKGATPLFQYQNAKGNIGDWYAKVDTTPVLKMAKAPSTYVDNVVTAPVLTPEQLVKLQALVAAGIL